MINAETIERIQIIKSEIYTFFESEIMWASMDEYISSSELVVLMDKIEERYGFVAEIEEGVISTVQDDNVRRYLWVGTQKIEMSEFKTLGYLADAITAAIAEEVEVVNLESTYYKELTPKCLEWACCGEQPNIFIEMLSAVSRDRLCDDAFAEILRNASSFIKKADYCGCGNTYYVEAQNVQKIWFDDVLAKNNNAMRQHRPRIEVLQALVDTNLQKTI